MVNVEGNFCTKPRISVLAYWAPKSTCKEGMLNWPIAFGFGFVRSGFCVWDVRNKGNKKKRFIFYFFCIKQRYYWKTKVVQKLTRKARPTQTLFSTQNTEQHSKKHKIQTKIKPPSTTKGSNYKVSSFFKTNITGSHKTCGIQVQAWVVWDEKNKIKKIYP